MTLLNIEKAILAGYSFGGRELTLFAEKYPHKVLKLVYLDAVYDSQGRREVIKNYPLSDVQPPDARTEFDSVEDYANYKKTTPPDLAVTTPITTIEATSFLDISTLLTAKIKLL